MAPNNSTGLYMPQTYSFLSPETFETLVEGYINQLHIRKRNKALITQQLANDCLMVLTNPENTAIFNPKFRWWVRKHFVFTVVGELRILLDKKNGKPVCVREQLYDKVCYFHHIIGHGGRDKTFAAITKSYSKVPAELVSLFTKNCQTCLGVRKYSKNKRPILPENEYPPHHPHHQQIQQSSQQAASAGLTCDTSFSSNSSSTAPSATSASTQYHSSSQQYGMINKGDQGAMTPISPMMHASGSGFFSSSAINSQQQHSFNAGYSYPQQSAQQQQQQQQLSQLQQQQIQQMHNVAMHAHHMSLSMGLSELSLGSNGVGTGISPSDMAGLSGLGQLNTSGLHGSISALSSACSTPTAMVKMDLPVVHSFDSNLISLAHLTQQNQYQSLADGTTDLDDTTSSIQHMYDRDQVDSFAAAAVASGQYSPLLEHEYQTTQSEYQDAYNHHVYAAHDYTAYTTTEPTSNYSMAMSSLATMSALMPSQGPTSYDSQPSTHDYSIPPQQGHSPLLSQNQMFQKQIQQEQQRFHQQQQHLMTASSTTAPIATTPPTLNVSTSLSSLSTSASSSSLASPPPSAVPSLTCSIPTPTTDSSSTLHSGGASYHSQLQQHQQYHHHHLTGLLDHEAKSRLSAVGSIISGVVHDL